MSNINFRLLENLFERREEQTGYFIGEQRKERYIGEKYNVHFPDPRGTLSFVREMEIKVKNEKQLFKELERLEAGGKREVINIEKIENGKTNI